MSRHRAAAHTAIRDPFLRSIAARASWAWERAPWGALEADVAGTPTRVLKRRLARWREVVGREDPDAFPRRLDWDGITERLAQCLVADIAPSAIVRLPRWTNTLRMIITSAAQPSTDPKLDLPLDGACDPADPIAFEEVFIPALAAARKRLAGRQAALDLLSDRAYFQLERSLLKRLSALAGTTLEAEFAKRRPFGATLLLRYGVEPIDPPGREQYDAFVAKMVANGLVPLFRTYPVLARLLAVAVNAWVEATAEMLGRLDRDRSSIAKLVGCRSAAALGRVMTAGCDLGDAHCGGRSVMSLTFACGATVMYKPKPVGLEVAFTGLIRWLNRSGAPLTLRAQRVLDRGNYGWVEYVETRPPADRQAKHRFYRRAGMLQSLLYAIGATDCHNENLVVNGDHLVLVDMETLVQPRLASIGEDEGHFDSVLRTGLLPQWECQNDTRRAVDVSGLGGTGHSLPERSWRFVNTDAMHLVRNDERIPSPRGDHHDAFFDGFEDDFVSGFRQVYRHLVRHRRALLATRGPLVKFRKLEPRLLFRATQTYVNIADGSLAPEHLRSGADWSLELDQLAFAFVMAERKPIAWPILDAERRSLAQLDVPYFTSNASGSTPLAQRAPLRGHVRANGYDETVARLTRLGERDLSLQTAIVRSVLRVYKAAPHAPAAARHRSDSTSVRVNPKPTHDALSFVDAASAIGRTLVQQAIVLSTDRVNWLGFTHLRNNDRLQLSLLSPNLYDGVCGVAVFLAALSRVTGISAFADLALQAVQPVRQSIVGRDGENASRLVDRLGLGVGLGAGSIVYALCRISTFLHDASLLDDATRLSRAIAPVHINNDKRFDVIGGSAGAILGLIALYRLTKDRAILGRAIACGRHLVRTQIARGPLAGSWRSNSGDAAAAGFAHGASGVAVALLRLYAITGQELFHHSAYRALAHERRALSAPWPRARPVSWCQGAPGIGLACVDALAVVDSRIMRGAARKAAALTAREAPHGLDYLCCGTLGRTETLFAAGMLLRERRLVDMAQTHGADVLARASSRGGYRLRPDTAAHQTLENPALFQGLSGIGYQFLRLAHPDIVPSLLLFH